jgi:hypothetical protein
MTIDLQRMIKMTGAHFRAQKVRKQNEKSHAFPSVQVVEKLELYMKVSQCPIYVPACPVTFATYHLILIFSVRESDG